MKKLIIFVVIVLVLGALYFFGGIKTEENSDKGAQKVYEIGELNKKDGDVFSLPDRVSYSVSNDVTKTVLKIETANGEPVYENVFTEKNITAEVYLSKKINLDSTGFLIVEGFDGDKSVVVKKIMIKF